MSQAVSSSSRPVSAQLLDALSTRWRVVPVVVSLLVIWGIFASLSPVFLTPQNMTNLADQITTTSIVALGLVMVLLVSEIDLSVAALSAVCAGVNGVLVANLGWPFPIALACALLTGGLTGMVQGSLVVFSGAPAFIISLGFSLALQGVLLILLPTSSGLVALAGTDVQAVFSWKLPSVLSYGLALLGGLVVVAVRLADHRKRLAYGLPSNGGKALGVGAAILAAALLTVWIFDSYRGVPVPLALLVGLFTAFSYLTTQTRFGTWLYGIGGNREATRRAGIPVNFVKISAFTLLGMLTAVGGMVASARVLGVSPASADETLLLESIAAAVIGGTSLFGGRGNVWSALLGALVIGSIANGMFLINASTEARLLVQGSVLVLAVLADATLARSTTAGRR